MPPIGWIHFSKTFSDRVNTILDLMDEEGMVDELGIGAFRDAFADIFFPGISTIQTRAKYFFIVPYLIKDYTDLPSNKQTGLEKFLYEAEHEIMWELAAAYDFDRNCGSGVIGITKKPRNRLSRSPSSIYWNGIRTLSFIKTNLSLSEYSYRLNESTSERLIRNISDTPKEGEDDDIDYGTGGNIKVSTYKKNWKESLDMPLDYEEGDFFKQQIIKKIPASLTAQIITKKSLRKLFFKCKNFREFSEVAKDENLDKELISQMILAHDLEVVNEGLHWVYSNEINKLHYRNSKFLKNWSEWKKNLYQQLIDLPNLKGETLSMIAPGAGNSIIFMTSIFDMVRQKKVEYKKMAELVIAQERSIKKGKSRFKPNAEKDFENGKPKSLSLLNYRYGNAKIIIKDIFDSLK